MNFDIFSRNTNSSIISMVTLYLFPQNSYFLFKFIFPTFLLFLCAFVLASEAACSAFLAESFIFVKSCFAVAKFLVSCSFLDFAASKVCSFSLSCCWIPSNACWEFAAFPWASWKDVWRSFSSACDCWAALLADWAVCWSCWRLADSSFT